MGGGVGGGGILAGSNMTDWRKPVVVKVVKSFVASTSHSRTCRSPRIPSQW